MSKREIDNKKINKLYHKLGLKYNLEDHVIKEIVESQYGFITEVMKNINVKEINTEEELEDVKTNFLIRHIGRLYTNFKIINRVKQIIKSNTKNGRND